MFPNFLDRQRTRSSPFKRDSKKGSFYRLRNNKWLHDERFEASLEEDNIDQSIVDREVAILQEEWQRKTKRKKLVKVLQSNPAQIAVSILVLIDVLLMVALLLIDVHVLKDKMNAKVVQINSVTEFLRERYSDRLANYTGEDVEAMLTIIKNDGKQPTQANNNNHKRSIDVFYATIDDTDFKESISNDNNRRFSGHVRKLRSSDRHIHSDDRLADERLDGVADDKSVAHSRVQRAAGAHSLSNGSNNTHHVGGDHTMEHLSHIFHISSIVILGIMLCEVLFKMAVMGKKFFDWKDGKLEIMDAVVVLVSFTLDLIFYKGIFATGISEATTLLLIFLIWRMIQVFNGVISTTKRRLEFRIRLQKKARRQAEEKLTEKEEQNRLLQDEINSFKALCRFHKVPEDEIVNCKPILATRGRCNSTSFAVSSIMRMSVGFVRHLSRADTVTTSHDSAELPISPTPSDGGSIDESRNALKPVASSVSPRSPRMVHKMDTLQEDNNKDGERKKVDFDSDTSDDVEVDERRKPPLDSGVGSSVEGSEKHDDADIGEESRDVPVLNDLQLRRSRSDYCKKGRKAHLVPRLVDLGLEAPEYPRNLKMLKAQNSSFSCIDLVDNEKGSTFPKNLSNSVGNNLHKKVIIVDKEKSRRSLKRQSSFDDNSVVHIKPETITTAEDIPAIQVET